jgi:hypothetical protein
LPSKLESLEISCCKELVVDSFPEEGFNLPRTLTELSIKGHLNLKTINQKGFGHLDSLQSLDIWNCPSLKCLPGERLPTSLSSLSIHFCPLLTERCKREKGEDWPKISHIANIYVDGKWIWCAMPCWIPFLVTLTIQFVLQVSIRQSSLQSWNYEYLNSSLMGGAKTFKFLWDGENLSKSPLQYKFSWQILKFNLQPQSFDA